MSHKYAFEPDYAVPPGATLRETLEAKGLLQSDLCIRTGLNPKTVSEIINGEAPLTLDTAEKLELSLGVSARFWNNLELRYRETQSRALAAERLEKDAAWLKSIPVKELADRGYIVHTSDKVDLVRQVLKFFGVSSVDAWSETWAKPAYQYRGSKAQQKHPGKVAAWLRMGELAAEKIQCKPYDAKKFREALREIRRNCVDKKIGEWLPTVIRLCADAGVAVVLVKQIPGASVSGATKWLNKDKAVIILSLKFKTDDHVWFTFFHEAAHVLLHGKKQVFVDNDENTDDELEAQANLFSRNALVPESHMSRLPHLHGQLDIRKFAREIRVAPGIVVGRLQRDKFLSPQYCNSLDLKETIEWPQIPDTAGV
jgi:HTH-type transcriptional regulator / antitoxin HigA